MGGAAGKKNKGAEEQTVITSKSPISSRRSSSRSEPCKLDVSCFQQLRTVGTGSYSVVKLCLEKSTGEPVVLKIMSKSHIIKKGQVEHIKNERAILSRVRSPFVEQLRATFQTPFSLYYVLEFIPGGELFKLLSDRSVLPAEEAVFYVAELVCGLKYLHGLNTLFRDLKPENVLIAGDGHIKIADFGFAKTLRPSEKTFTLCGTPEYLAPEVIERVGHGLCVDWWQLGIIVYEILYAVTPFADPSPYQLYENILSKKLTFPNGTEVTKSFISGLLQKNPASRLSEEEICAHPFFAGVDWKRAERRELSPPFVPTLNSPTDTSNFDEYADEPGQGTAVYVDVFPEF